MTKSKTTTPATSVVESAYSSTRKATARTGTTTTSVKIAKQRGTSALNSNPSTETTMSVNFYDQPVGRAVLYLNGFHFGEFISKLNKAARLVPDQVQGYASIVASTPNVGADNVEVAIRHLGEWADDAEQLEESLRSDMFNDSEKFTA